MYKMAKYEPKGKQNNSDSDAEKPKIIASPVYVRRCSKKSCQKGKRKGSYKTSSGSDSDDGSKRKTIITTEGLTQQEVTKYNLAHTLKKCTGCNKFYKKTLFVGSHPHMNTCHHCFFQANYDVKNRMSIDKQHSKNNLFVAIYVIDCKDAHNSAQCRAPASCYLCDYNNSKLITNILWPEVLYPNGKPELKVVKDVNQKQNNVSDSHSDDDVFQERTTLRDIVLPRKVCI